MIWRHTETMNSQELQGNTTIKRMHLNAPIDRKSLIFGVDYGKPGDVVISWL